MFPLSNGQALWAKTSRRASWPLVSAGPSRRTSQSASPGAGGVGDLDDAQVSLPSLAQVERVGHRGHSTRPSGRWTMPTSWTPVVTPVGNRPSSFGLAGLVTSNSASPANPGSCREQRWMPTAARSP